MNTAAWLTIAVIMFIFEAITVGLICIWFSFGALGAFAVTFVTDNIIIQLIVFAAVSALSFMIVRPLMKKTMPVKDNTNSTNRLIGKSGRVIEKIDEYNGRVMVGDVSWIAKSKDIIEEGTIVKIIKAEGNVLTVEQVKKEDNL